MPSSPVLQSLIPDLSPPNTSKTAPPWLYVLESQAKRYLLNYSCSNTTTFTVPGTHISLVMRFGRTLPREEVATVLIETEALVTEEVEDHHRRFEPAKMPFKFSADAGTEIQIYNSGEVPSGMTWGQLQTTLHGLYIFMIGGDHYLACHFDIFAAQTGRVFLHLGWGNLVQVNEPNPDIPGSASQATSSQRPTALSVLQSVDVSDPDLLNLEIGNSSLFKLSSLNIRNAPFHFQVPNTELSLSLTVREEKITLNAIEGLLIRANGYINNEIYIHGGSGAIPGTSFQYGLVIEGVLLEVMSWRSAPNGLTWGQLAAIVQGLALFYFGEHSFGCHFKALYGNLEMTVGIGRIAKGAIRS